MSFKSSDDCDKEEAQRYFNLYIEARDSAFEVAQQAAIKGDVESLDKIINSINSAKDLQNERSNLNGENINKGSHSSTKDAELDEILNSQVQDILSEFSNIDFESQVQNTPKKEITLETDHDKKSKNEIYKIFRR